MLLTDILTVAQVAVISFNTNYMQNKQVAKVVIASVLVCTAYAEEVPEGKGCVLKCSPVVTFPQTCLLY